MNETPEFQQPFLPFFETSFQVEKALAVASQPPSRHRTCVNYELLKPWSHMGLFD